MSRISRQKEKYGNGDDLSGDNANEGTSARTRPFSFEDIMLRRKNKKLNADAKQEVAGVPEKSSGKNNVEVVYDKSESDEVYRLIKESTFSATKVTSEDTAKGSSRKKEEMISLKEGNLVTSKSKESREPEVSLMKKSDKYSGTRAEGGKNEKQSHRGSRTKERLRDDFGNESKRKRHENPVGKEKHRDNVTGKSEKESKRKHRSRDGEKNRPVIDGNVVKKHDSGKWYDPEPAERTSWKKDTSQSRYEEARPKRRRSKSRETRDRDRKSISLSPRTYKRTPHDGREHGDSSLHSFKDRRQHSDVDRNKISSNGGFENSHHRRHGGHGSRLGGYSPRKRRSEAAVKTPSPTVRSPERKSIGWDLPPSGTGIISAGSILPSLQSSHKIVSSSAHDSPNTVSLMLDAARSLAAVSSNILSTTKDASIDSIQLTQATRPMRRLYVENVPASASDKSLMEHFNNFLLSSGVNHIQGIQPCISCIINKQNGQALVEFISPEDATTALSFDGKSFSGTTLKIKRPKDFVEAATGVPEKSVVAVDTISDVVKDSPHKIFIGGISKDLSSDMLMEIARAFGPLKAYHYRVNEDSGEPCAFLEYVDHSITPKACAGLNGMKLGGQVLVVVQAVTKASTEENTEKPSSYGIPEHAKPLLSKPTKVLKLKNLLDSNDLPLLSGPELEETLEDIRLECARFGAVKSVNIVKHNSCAAASEALEVDKENGVSSSQDPEFEDYAKKTEIMEEDIEQNYGENSAIESPNDVRGPLEVGNIEDNRVSDDKPEGDVVRDGMSVPCQLDSSLTPEVPMPHLVTDTNPQESSGQLDVNKDQLTSSADFIQDDSNMKNSSRIEEELKQEEGNGELQEASIELKENVGRESDQNKHQVIDIDDIFEQGCILVEFTREEASCMAAHCLHGRLYGDQVVAVNYVAHDLYLSKFPK